MIKGMSHVCQYVLDQDSAKTFYTEKLGFEVRNDVLMGESFEGAGAGLRWLTVSPPGTPGNGLRVDSRVTFENLTAAGG